eukprot:220798_1
MSFVKDINPFTGIICMPYYYLWILIMFSWLLVLIEWVFVYLMEIWQQYLSKQTNNLENKINEQIHTRFQIELENTTIDGIILPNEIISLIMSMLPQKHDHAKTYLQNAAKTLQQKEKIIQSFQCVYPMVRFFCNFANLIIVFVYYGQWYGENENISNWRKYCAFILIFFYMPNCKGRAFMTMFYFEWMEFDKFGYGVLNYISLCLEWGFGLLLFFISFPVIMSGLFVYIPTTIIIGICAVIIFGAVFLIVSFLLRPICLGEEIPFLTGFAISSTFCTMWFFITVIVSTMEFFDHGNWVKSWEIGFLGEYCHQDDYFSLSKWSEYPMDIKFLIVSWVIF